MLVKKVYKKQVNQQVNQRNPIHINKNPNLIALLLIKLLLLNIFFLLRWFKLKSKKYKNNVLLKKSRSIICDFSLPSWTSLIDLLLFITEKAKQSRHFDYTLLTFLYKYVTIIVIKSYIERGYFVYAKSNYYHTRRHLQCSKRPC